MNRAFLLIISAFCFASAAATNDQAIFEALASAQIGSCGAGSCNAQASQVYIRVDIYTLNVLEATYVDADGFKQTLPAPSATHLFAALVPYVDAGFLDGGSGAGTSDVGPADITCNVGAQGTPQATYSCAISRSH